MGVHGFWKLIEPSGQMVPLESLAGKVLAVDVSIWLHQAVKGMQDASGAPVAVAHLLILFHRVCKLLFYKIKPVFVFDGGVPALKHQTMAARRQQSSSAKSEAMKVREKLIKNLLKHEAVRQVLSNESASAALGLNSFTLPGPSVEEDLYKLPPIAASYDDSESSESLGSNDEDERFAEDIHSIDVTSKDFLNLPPEVRHDILTDLIETRKQSSWKYLDEMPKKSDSFSDFQMNRLLKRHAVQTSLDKAGKEMGGRPVSLKELESMLGDRGVLDPKTDLPSRRIAQDSVTHYMLVQKNLDDNNANQKNVNSASETFNIMNHLEDVDWSSDTETCFSLEKSADQQVISDSVDLSKQKQLIKKDVELKETNLSSLPNQPKICVTEEVANILSVLEDEDVASDIKVKVVDLQSRITSNESKKQLKIEYEKASEIVKSVEEKKYVSETSSNLIEHFPSISINENESESLIVASAIQELEKKVENSIEKDKSTAKSEAVSLTNNKFQQSTSLNNFEKSVNVTDSSSDSEGEFIPVTETCDYERNETATQIYEVPNEKDSESLGHLPITINSSDVNVKDDIFADLFQSVSNEIHKTGSGKEEEEELKGEKRDIETYNDNEGQAKEVLNEYKIEFENQMAKGDLKALKKSLEDQQLELIREQGKQERHALNPTDQMYSDAQELLRLFGIPFIVAPMEAEAQCATLDLIGLTEGTITDDSDIWLFGGRVVYKNFFNQNKHVLEYRSENIQKYFRLTREDMIRMAMLVGSDYTLGLNGIGPVTAMEILASFQSPNQDLLDGLQKFRDWFVGKCKNGPPRATLKRKIKNIIISPGFPNRAVVEAYLNPQVDNSKESFSWARPNLELIHKYTKLKMGWSHEKCDELLLPVLKKLDEKTSQNTMEKYFKITQKTSLAENVLSKRVENAIKKLKSGAIEEMDYSGPRKRKKPAKIKGSGDSEIDSQEMGKNSAPLKKPKSNTKYGLSGPSPANNSDATSKALLINQKLHKTITIPQKEMTQKLMEQRKKQAIEIFRTYKKGSKQKIKVVAKEDANLSESSSEED